MIKAIIFDLDGTLLNTLEDLADSVNHVLKAHNMKTRTLDEIRSFIGNGVPTLIKRSVQSGTSEEETVVCTKEMRAYYNTHSDVKTRPYDGIIEVLNELKKAEIMTCVVTNKLEDTAKILCDAKFGDVFTCVIGDNGKDKLKPAPDNVLRALYLLDVTNDEVLYVGDSDVDMITAANASLKSVGVTWGFRDRECLKNNGANYVIDTPFQLLNILKTLNVI